MPVCLGKPSRLRSSIAISTNATRPFSSGWTNRRWSTSMANWRTYVRRRAKKRKRLTSTFSSSHYGRREANCRTRQTETRRTQYAPGSDTREQRIQSNTHGMSVVCHLILGSLCLQNAVDKALYKANTAIFVGTSTWLEQFKQAFSVKGRQAMCGTTYDATVVFA